MTDLREQLEQSLSGTYSVERELGGGGMSRVFLATERSLSRRVVIKVLPPEMAASVSMERFRREIMLAARLQNAHIVPLLSAGETSGLPYLTMPFVDGESLRVRLSRGGELPIAEGLRILREVATALDYAHEEGIIHRDIKPDNVLLSHGSAMVTDFGVAKAISSSSNEEHDGVTSFGIALGTPAYMSPEQAAAAPDIDARADIYAFGVLAYELFAGRPPFHGRSPQALLAAQVTETPEPIQKLRPSLPPALSTLVMRCLEKHAADRPQRASEIIHALDAITTPSGGSPPTLALSGGSSSATHARRRRMIVLATVACAAAIGVIAVAMRTRTGSAPNERVMLAVLPFENQGPASDDYFGDGLADAITNRLASVPTLGVIAQRSASQYKHSSKSLSEIGRELHVQYVLQGTVRWENGADGARKAQISPSLIRVSDATVKWAADPYIVTLADAFVIQSDIASRVASALDVAFARSSAPSAADRPTANAAAYDAYLRGVEFQSQYFKDLFDTKLGELANEQFARAIHLDTTFALAEARLALGQAWLFWTGGGDPANAQRAQRSIERAFVLDPRLPEAHVAKGVALETLNTDIPAAIAQFDSALALRPGDALALSLGGDARCNWGDSTGLAMLARSMELDPLNTLSVLTAVQDFTQFRHFAEADRYASQWDRLAPQNQDPLVLEAAIAVAARGDTTTAVRLSDEAERRSPGPDLAMLLLYSQVSWGASRAAQLRLSGVQAQSKIDTLVYYMTLGGAHRRLGKAATARAYSDSVLSLSAKVAPTPGVLGVQWSHGGRAAAASLAGNEAEFKREANLTLEGLAAYGERNVMLANWYCYFAAHYASFGDVDGAVSHARKCLTLPSGNTTWNIRLHPDWQGILGKPQVQALLKEFSR